MGAAPRLPNHPSRGHDRSITRPPGGRPLPLRLRFDLAALMPHIRQRVVAAGGSMSTFSIRLARQSDAPRMAVMSRDLIETGLGWRWRPERILACLRDRATNGLVAVERQRMIGFAVMKYLDEQAHLLLLAVAPGRRRSGVGRALFAWLEVRIGDWALIVPLGLYAAAHLGVAPPVLGTGTHGGFNPFAWQILFLVGATAFSAREVFELLLPPTLLSGLTELTIPTCQG